jgi:hypothetical protein
MRGQIEILWITMKRAVIADLLRRPIYHLPLLWIRNGNSRIDPAIDLASPPKVSASVAVNACPCQMTDLP